MSTMGWQFQHQHATKCNSMPLGQQPQQQSPYVSNAWATMKSTNANGPMMNNNNSNNYPNGGGVAMSNMSNYSQSGDMYAGCPPTNMPKMYSTPATAAAVPATTNAKGQTMSG